MISFKNKLGFSLLEMLISIGILAVLVSVAVMVINPIEYLRQARDSTRVSDLNNINTYISRYKYSGQRIDSLGNINVVYVSIPSNLSDCSDLGLPALASGWAYKCATETDYKKIDGTGWLPINLAAFSGGFGISALSVDPTNTASDGLYYKYIISASGGFEINASMESRKFNIGGKSDKVSTDGGDDPYIYEVGTNFDIFKYEVLTNADFGAGSLSGWVNWASGTTGTTNSLVHWAPNSAIIQNSNSYCNNYYAQDIAVSQNTDYTIGAWIKTVSEVGNSFIGIADTSWGGWIGSSQVTGTNNWTYVTATKNSGALSTMRFFLSVGWCGGPSPGNGPSGTTYFAEPSAVRGSLLLNNK